MKYAAIAILVAVSFHWLTVGAFLMLREPATAELMERDRLYLEEGTLKLSSGDPWMVVADRPLFSWSEWHGGEVWWVKIVELANFPSLLLADSLSEAAFFGDSYRMGPYHEQSWARAKAFAVVSTVQWMGVGALVGFIWSLIWQAHNHRLERTSAR